MPSRIGSIHKAQMVNRRLARRPGFKVHLTRTGCPWVDAVESWFSELESRAGRSNAFHGVKGVVAQIGRHLDVYNSGRARPFVWTKTAASIIAKLDQAKKALSL